MEVKAKKGLWYYVYIFFCVSILAWIFEILYSLVFRAKFVLPGVLIGPWCSIYGLGILISFLVIKKEDSVIINFIKAFLSASIIEYTISNISEKLFNHIIWNYGKFMFNINGRICLHMTLLFATFGLISIYLLEPLLSKIYKKNKMIIDIISIILLVFYIFDWIIILYRL